MKSASSELIEFLATKKFSLGDFVLADLYTFTLTSGYQLFYTTADIDISDGTNTFVASGPFFDKLQTHKGFHAKTGLDTDVWEVTVVPRQTDPITGQQYPDTIGDIPWLQAAVYGILGGATVQVDRQFFPSWPTGPWGENNPFPPSNPSLILSKLFTGRIGPIKYSRTSATITINSWMNLLSTTQMPPNYYGASCRHTLFDAGCTLNAASYATPTVVSYAPGYNSNLLSVSAPSLPGGAQSWALGRIVMTSGVCKGLQKRILGWQPDDPVSTSITLTLDYPFPFTVNAYDSCTLYPGCDKSTANCTTYGNLVNYGGFPYIPSPELGF
jgi:hypothetical protein